MNQEINQQFPKAYNHIADSTKGSEFDMASDVLTCSLLRTLASSKPAGKFLELGTGTGLSTSWILDGMDEDSILISIDNDDRYLKIAEKHLGYDNRLSLTLTDGEVWLNENIDKKFDFIFADTWHGKYLLLDETLSMLNKGGFYIVDDMLPQVNWPEGHQEKAINFVKYIESRKDLLLTKQVWATGIVIGVKL